MDKHKFKVGDDCPFCDGTLYDDNYEIKVETVLKCNNKDCWFNKVEFDKSNIL